MTHIPAYSAQVKRGAKILAMSYVVENPDGQILIVQPEQITGFQIDVKTEWLDNIMTKMGRQSGRIELLFDALVIQEVRAARQPSRREREIDKAIIKKTEEVPGVDTVFMDDEPRIILPYAYFESDGPPTPAIPTRTIPIDVNTETDPPTFTIWTEPEGEIADDCTFDIEEASDGTP